MSEKNGFAFVWKIENFWHLVLNNCSMLRSPFFKAANAQWRLELNHLTVQSCRYVCLRLRNEGPSSHLRSGTVEAEVSILAPDNTLLRRLKVSGMAVAEWTEQSCVDFAPITEVSEIVRDSMRVLCRIWQQGQQGGQRCARTVFISDTFLWNVELFSSSQKTTNKTIELGSHLFEIQLTKGGTYAVDKSVDVRTILKEEEDLQYAHCKLFVVHADNPKPVLLLDQSFATEVLSRSWTFPIRLTQEFPLPDDSLPLKYEFTVATNELWIDPLPPLFTKGNVQTCESRSGNCDVGSLTDDIARLYTDRMYCDVTLESSSGEELPAHRIILSARSPVFESMLKDNETTTVVIPDVDPRTLHSMLLFMYSGRTGRALMEWQTACKLYVAANSYGVRDLQRECLAVLRSSLNITNVCEALSVCASSEGLKECVYGFLRDHFEKVNGSESWKALNGRDPKLVNEVLSEMLLKKFKK